MIDSARLPSLLVAALAGLGVTLLAFALWRAGRRTTTSRRIATLLALDEPLPGPASPLVIAPPRWRLELVHAIGALEARGARLRLPAIGLACLTALIGVSTLAPAWLALAAASGMLAYWLGGRSRRQ